MAAVLGQSSDSTIILTIQQPQSLNTNLLQKLSAALNGMLLLIPLLVVALFLFPTYQRESLGPSHPLQSDGMLKQVKTRRFASLFLETRMLLHQCF